MEARQDYLYERPSLTFRKLRRLELAAGAPTRWNAGGRLSPGTADIPAQWKAERAQSQHIAQDPRAVVTGWQPERPSAPTDFIRHG